MKIYSYTNADKKLQGNFWTFYITNQINLCFKVATSPNMPFTFELGLLFITFELTLWKRL